MIYIREFNGLLVLGRDWYLLVQHSSAGENNYLVHLKNKQVYCRFNVQNECFYRNTTNNPSMDSWTGTELGLEPQQRREKTKDVEPTPPTEPIPPTNVVTTNIG